MTRTGTLIGALTVSVAIVVTNLLVAFGVPLDVAQLAAINAAATLLGTLLVVALTVLSLPKDKVLEYLVGPNVVAGEANDMIDPGTEVRTLGRHALHEPDES